MKNLQKVFLIFIGVIFAGVLLAQAQIEDPCPSQQSVVLNQKAKLKCNYRNVQGLRQWSVIDGQETKPLDPNVFQQEPDGVAILKVTRELEGTSLRVKIINPVTGAQIKLSNIVIKVYGPPEIKALDSKVYIEDITNISCQATGIPTPTITWVYQLSERLNPSLIETDSSGVSYLQVLNRPGAYQCQADNGYGLAIDNINVLSKSVREEEFAGIKSLTVERVAESSIVFKVELDAESDDKVTKIRYMYTLYSENKMMREDHNGTEMVQDGSFTLNGFPGGAYVVFHFASASTASEAVKLSSGEGLLVTLLPPAPQIAVIEVTSEFITIEWRETWIARSSNTNGIDFYELKYSQLSQNGDEFQPPSCTVETKIPSCVGSKYKIYRRSTIGYSLIEIRAHNIQGYSAWSNLLVSNYR